MFSFYSPPTRPLTNQTREALSKNEYDTGVEGKDLHKSSLIWNSYPIIYDSHLPLTDHRR